MIVESSVGHNMSNISLCFHHSETNSGLSFQSEETSCFLLQEFGATSSLSLQEDVGITLGIVYSYLQIFDWSIVSPHCFDSTVAHNLSVNSWKTASSHVCNILINLLIFLLGSLIWLRSLIEENVWAAQTISLCDNCLRVWNAQRLSTSHPPVHLSSFATFTYIDSFRFCIAAHCLFRSFTHDHFPSANSSDSSNCEPILLPISAKNLNSTVSFFIHLSWPDMNALWSLIVLKSVTFSKSL